MKFRSTLFLPALGFVFSGFVLLLLPANLEAEPNGASQTQSQPFLPQRYGSAGPRLSGVNYADESSKSRRVVTGKNHRKSSGGGLSYYYPREVYTGDDLRFRGNRLEDRKSRSRITTPERDQVVVYTNKRNEKTEEAAKETKVEVNNDKVIITKDGETIIVNLQKENTEVEGSGNTETKIEEVEIEFQPDAQSNDHLGTFTNAEEDDLKDGHVEFSVIEDEEIESSDSSSFLDDATLEYPSKVEFSIEI